MHWTAANGGIRTSTLAPGATAARVRTVSRTAVAIAGEIDIRTYQAKDGSTKAELTCNVQKVTLLGSGEQKAKAEKPVAKPAQTVPDDLDDNIPFAFLLAPLAGLLIAAIGSSGLIA